ncbi:E3 ubiquitin-protein ligase TRIM33-like [Mercenaria mercenaria]|uniref:E3 ubiquitin-protein ligase TRIM33-like n=1 Tax=Mercenaria mercenaria TaxID=6596 RepID=UPI00234F0EB8|nr:E3 ubiquitin-protein ligase TRIM33-like [Mercenaria mercenaria]
MAEGRNQTSIQDGSDADIAFACTPCSADGTREEAIKYCSECDEYLCTTCTKYHHKMKASRDHKLVDTEEGRQELLDVKTTAKIKCRQPQDRDIEMFCGTHDMVYCLMCIATDHRSFCDVTSLKDASRTNFQHEDIERLKDESESLKERLVASEKKKQENIVFVEEKRNNIQKRVTEVEDGMIQHIKTLSKQANCTLNETYTIVKSDLESYIAKLRRRI